ncbi:MAG: cadherin domain-containing protein, partial [Pseudomonadota bacterium]
LDGAEVDSDPYTGGIGNADDEPITIGASQRFASTEGQAQPGQIDRFFDGQIAEVALYGSALSAIELAALADSGINGYDIPGDTIAEGAQNGTVVGVVEARDPDSGEAFTYSLLDDSGGRFAIDGTTGEISVLDGSKLDYESAQQHTVNVQVTDSGGLSYNDSFVINLVDMAEVSGPGNMIGSDASEIMTGTDLSEGAGGEEIILGMGGDDRLEGHGNEDRLVGGEGADSLSGGAGADILIGDDGNDVSDGGSGDDAFVFRMGDGNDTISGGTGTDAIVLMGADGGVPSLSDWSLNLTTGSATWSTDQVTLSSDATGTITFTDGSSIAFDSIERIDFSGDYLVDGGRSAIDIAAATGETISAGSTEDTLIGGIGADTLSGGANEDLILGNEGADDLSGGDDNDVLYGGSGADTMAGDAGDDMLVGGDGNDTIHGGAPVTGKAADAGGDDTLYGNAGDDSLSGGIGTDFLVGGSGADTMDGGDGIDTASYADSSAAVTVDLGARTGVGGDAEGDTLVRIENVTGSDFNDTLTGDSADNTLVGGAGDDTLHGGTAGGGKGATIGGNDTLLGGAGNDQLDGGDGDDTLSGGEGDDVLIGGVGADDLDGGVGLDTISYSGSSAGVSVNLAAGTASGGDAAGDTFSGIENITGSDHNDVLTGDAGDNVLTGGQGDDTAFGGAGDDTYVFGDGDGSDSFDGGGGSWTDTVQLSGKDGLDAYNGWTVTGVTITSSGDDFIELADDSDGTITLDDGSELTFTDVDRIEW